MDPSAPWVWATTTRYELAGEGFISGQLVVPMHIVGRDGLFPFWFATPYPWDKNHRNYSFELLGRQIKSAEDAQCPREAIWRMTVEEDPELDGPGTVELGVWQSLAIHRTARVYRRADWRPGWTDVEYGSGGMVLGEDDDDTAAKKGLKLLRDIPISTRGKKEGDGQLWPGGEEEFLDDLWTTVERYTASTGRRRPEIIGTRGESFRTMMQRRPAERTLRDWLGKVGLRPRDIESGNVTRANYSQFVAEQGSYSGR